MPECFLFTINSILMNSVCLDFGKFSNTQLLEIYDNDLQYLFNCFTEYSYLKDCMVELKHRIMGDYVYLYSSNKFKMPGIDYDYYTKKSIEENSVILYTLYILYILWLKKTQHSFADHFSSLFKSLIFDNLESPVKSVVCQDKNLFQIYDLERILKDVKEYHSVDHVLPIIRQFNKGDDSKSEGPKSQAPDLEEKNAKFLKQLYEM